MHLIHAELHGELRAIGFDITAGQIGKNITTRGLDLLGLPTGVRLHMAAVLGHDEAGNLVRKAGVMGVVVASGDMRPGDAIRVELPLEPRQALERV